MGVTKGCADFSISLLPLRMEIILSFLLSPLFVEVRKSFLILAILMMVSIILLASVLLVAFAKPAEWDFARKLYDTGHSGAPNMCRSDEYTHLAYMDFPPMGDGYVTHRRSSDGKTWQRENRLSGPEEMRFHELSGVRIACWGEEVHIAWVSSRYVEFDGGFVSAASVLYRTSTNDGETWSDTYVLNNKWPYEISGFEVFVSDQLVVVAWNDFSFSDYDWCNYVISHDRGRTWTDQEELYPQVRSMFINMAIEGNTIYAYTNIPEVDSNLDYGNATLLIGGDGDREWSTISLRDHLGLDKLYLRGIAMHGGRLLATSHSGLLVSDDYGLNWTISQSAFDGSSLIEGEGESLIIAIGSEGASFNVSTDCGVSWTYVSMPEVEGMWTMDRTVFASNVSFLYVSFEDPEVYLLTSGDFGQTWVGPTRVTDHDEPLLVILFSVAVGLLSATVALTVYLSVKRLSEGEEPDLTR